MVCRAEAPSGPFFDKEGRSCLIGNGGSEILGSHDVVYAPGGQGVYYDDCIGSVILYYHYRKSCSSSSSLRPLLISVIQS